MQRYLKCGYQRLSNQGMYINIGRIYWFNKKLYYPKDNSKLYWDLIPIPIPVKKKITLGAV